jgi:putative transcriptional regulator
MEWSKVLIEANMSLLKQGKVKGIRFETLQAICAYLDCQPGDLLAYVPDGASSH